VKLTLPYPISANRYWRTFMPKGFKAPVTAVSDEARAYKRQVAEIVERRCLTPRIMGRVKVSFDLFPHRPQDFERRQRKHGELWDDTVQCLDLDNAQKVMLDCLKGVLFDDDKFVREIHGRRMEPDALGARLVVHVEPIVQTSPQIPLLDEPEAAPTFHVKPKPAKRDVESISTAFD